MMPYQLSAHDARMTGDRLPGCLLDLQVIAVLGSLCPGRGRGGGVAPSRGGAGRGGGGAWPGLVVLWPAPASDY